MGRLDLDRIRAAVEAIDPVFLRSPQFESPALSPALGCSLVLKVETMNPVRSFKGRGTETVLARLVDAGEHGPVVGASAGNLGQASPTAPADTRSRRSCTRPRPPTP